MKQKDKQFVVILENTSKLLADIRQHAFVTEFKTRDLLLTYNQQATVTVAYLVIVDEPVSVTGQDNAAKAEWWPLSDLPHLAFDHYDIMQDAIALYKAKLNIA